MIKNKEIYTVVESGANENGMNDLSFTDHKKLIDVASLTIGNELTPAATH